jgi:hypothetical protein
MDSAFAPSHSTDDIIPCAAAAENKLMNCANVCCSIQIHELLCLLEIIFVVKFAVNPEQQLHCT